MALPAAKAFGGRYAPIMDLVTLCYVRFESLPLERHVQPATMLGFKQIEFFDHTGPLHRAEDAGMPLPPLVLLDVPSPLR